MKFYIHYFSLIDFMMRCVRFSAEISKDILQAINKVMNGQPKYILICKKGDGSTAFDFLAFDTREKLQKLADALNKKFPMRHYSVITVESAPANNLELVK